MKALNVSEETYAKIKEQLSTEEAIDFSCMSDFIGCKLFIRTVTYHMVGKVVAIVGPFFQLENASWIAVSGRFMQSIKEGQLDEVEPVGTAWVSYAATTDMFPWNHELPTVQS